MHCWQADDVSGFENQGGSLTGGIQVTGNYPGRARTIDEVRADVLKAASLIAGKHRLNLHEIYGDFQGRKVDRDEVEPAHFESWMQWAKENGMKLDDETRYMSILASLIGCQGVDAYKVIVAKALDSGLSPMVIKEIVYQSVDYLGMGRVWPFLVATNVVMEAKGIELPLLDSTRTKQGRLGMTKQERLEKAASDEPETASAGAEAAEEEKLAEQAGIFEEHMKEVWKDSHINKWLKENYFGNDYPGSRLPLAKRELVTFCFLFSQGGCDMQVVAHAKGNMKIGNDKELLMRVISQSLPYIGYPRCLNAVNCVNEAERQMKQE